MKMRKVISAFLVLICLFAIFGLCTLGASAAEGAKTVYATTSTSIKQGSYGYLYVYLDDLTDLSALNVSVYYDTEKITVQSVYNQVPSVVNDISTGDGCVNASYIFDGKGSATKTNLFYIYYQVDNSAEVGDTYFDIVVNEAYNSSLEGMDFTGSRCALEITEKTVSKSCTISTSSKISTSVGEEFELSYRLNTYQIASGSMNIQYDPELFEVVSVTNGGFLTDKIADVNTALNGTVAISFVGTTYQSKYDVITVRFKTLKNVTESSDIKLVVTNLYDKELNLYSCSGCTTRASIVFDETYTEDAPSMSVSSSYNAETGKVTATIKLEKDSHLGAGDFVLKFDTRYLTYISSKKGFSPTFFNINDKDAADGILKFSLISLSDITDEQIVLTATFDAKHHCQDKTAEFEITGSGLTDSLVNAILLNFVDSSVIIPLKHTEADAVEENRTAPTCTDIGGYDNVVYCTVCGAELSREHIEIPANGHTPADAVEENHVDPTCIEIGGYDMVVYCTVCDVELSREHYDIEALGHAPAAEWTVDLAPTCIEVGSKSHHCTRCDEKLDISEVPANGHAPSEAVEKNRVEPTCTVSGKYDAVTYCGVCQVELSREQLEIAALGHTHKTAVTAPTCTEQGYTTYTCACGDTYADNYVSAAGHKPGDWIVETEPQVGVPGSKYIICTVCLEKLLTEEIAPLPEPETETKTETETETEAETETETEAETEAEAETETETEFSGGCNGMISASVALLALLSCFAVAWRPRKEN